MRSLLADRLVKGFGSYKAVNGVSFEVKPGRCTALLGPNGAGKTTVLRMLAGLLTPDGGTVAFEGEGPKADLRRRLGYLPQAPAFYGWMTGLEYAVFAAELSGMKGGEARTAAREALSRFGLEEAGKRRIAGYSGGMKQRLGLAQALVHRPELLLLDEPVSALDPAGRREVMERLRELKSGMTILFSTHVLHDAEEICDDLIFVNNGGIADKGELTELRSKYRQPVITLRTERTEQARDWLKAAAALPFVLEAKLGEDELRITVAEMAAARDALLAMAARDGVPLLGFEAGASSLEDVYMKVVGA